MKFAFEKSQPVSLCSLSGVRLLQYLHDKFRLLIYCHSMPSYNPIGLEYCRPLHGPLFYILMFVRLEVHLGFAVIYDVPAFIITMIMKLVSVCTCAVSL
jgi:hypothetical protein